MTHIGFLLERFAAAGDAPALIWQDAGFSYAWLRAEVAHMRTALEDAGVPDGTVASLEADFSPKGMEML